ncbi:MAG TPA: hypothetical protein VGQ69_05410 [Gemmatimonadales bacterium]|nr:hypothetical protein [Gemmatimonadales bacterium]
MRQRLYHSGAELGVRAAQGGDQLGRRESLDTLSGGDGSAAVRLTDDVNRRWDGILLGR